jgi:hypothetical protein
MYNHDPYFFGPESPPVLSLYEKARPDGLRAGEVILLSSVPPGGSDSGSFGICSVRDLIAKVEKLDK